MSPLYPKQQGSEEKEVIVKDEEISEYKNNLARML